MKSTFRFCVVTTSIAVSILSAQPKYTISSVAGLPGGSLQIGMSATQVYLPGTHSVVADSFGRTYISAYLNGIIRIGQNGLVDLIVGFNQSGFSGDGSSVFGTNPIAFSGAGAMAVDSSGNLFVVDTYNYRVRRIDVSTGIVSTVAGSGATGDSGDGGPATAATFNWLQGGLAVDASGNLYIGDSQAGRVRKVDARTGIITNFAGNGQGSTLGSPKPPTGDGGLAVNAAVQPNGMAFNPAGDLYIADAIHSTIRKVSTATGVITTVVGGGLSYDSGDDGPAVNAQLQFPQAVTFDRQGVMYIATYPHIRKVSTTGIITTIGGSGLAGPYSGDGVALQATLAGMSSLSVNSAGKLLMTQWDSGGAPRLVLALDVTAGTIATAAGSVAGLGDGGPATSAVFGAMYSMTSDSSGNIYIGDSSTGRVRKISSTTGLITTVAGNGNLSSGGDGGLATNASFSYDLSALAVNPAGDLFINDSQTIRKVAAQTGIVTTVAGGGQQTGDNIQATSAKLEGANDGELFADNSAIYFHDNRSFRKVDLTSGLISTLASDPDNSFPSGGDLDSSGTFYYTTLGSGMVDKISTGQTSPTVLLPGHNNCQSGSGCTNTTNWTGAQLGDGGAAKDATLFYPSSVKVDPSGNLFIADGGNRRIRYVSSATGIISTVAGSNASGCAGASGPATAALFSGPSDISFGPSRSLYVLDSVCQQVYKLTPQVTYAGYLDAVNCQTISGWAADRERPGVSINVSIYDGTTLVATIPANQSRTDVGALLGDNGLHGFTYTTPASLRDGAAHTLHVVYETNAASELSNSPKALTCGTAYAGSVDSATCSGGFTGWVADRNRLNTPITVSLWEGATQIASTTANGSRPDVGAVLGDNGLHGFSFTIPAAYQNGVAHTLSVHYETSGTMVPNGTATLTCGGTTPPPVKYAGYVDASSCSAGLTGWAADKNRLNTPITVTLWDGATQIASTTANGSRADVGAALGDNGLHGFSLAVPSAYQNGVAHTLSVNFETSTTQLTGSPVTLNCGSSGGGSPLYAGWVDTASCSGGISGWAADKKRLNTPITVSLWNGTTQLASVTANGSRADVGALLGDNGLHGFSLPIPQAAQTGSSVPLQVRFEASGTALPGTSTTLTCGGGTGSNPPNYTGWTDAVSCTAISGWAADKNNLNTSVNVGIYDGSTLLGTVAATASRGDVGAVLGDNGLHGFSFATPASLKDGAAHSITVRPGNSTTALAGGQTLVCH